jgi:hypothetical protein
MARTATTRASGIEVGGGIREEGVKEREGQGYEAQGGGERQHASRRERRRVRVRMR